MGFEWIVAPAQVFPEGYRNYSKHLYTSAKGIADFRAAEATAWMKQNAPWADVSGAARAGLGVDVVQDANILAQLIFHHGDNVSYGINLELDNQGRYAILAPAVDLYGPQFMSDLRMFLDSQIPRG